MTIIILSYDDRHKKEAGIVVGNSLRLAVLSSRDLDLSSRVLEISNWFLKFLRSRTEF